MFGNALYAVSADMAHGVHPNFVDKHEEHHRPVMQKGIVIKHNANQRYATSGVTAFLFKEVGKMHSLPTQVRSFLWDCPIWFLETYNFPQLIQNYWMGVIITICWPCGFEQVILLFPLVPRNRTINTFPTDQVEKILMEVIMFCTLFIQSLQIHNRISWCITDIIPKGRD